MRKVISAKEIEETIRDGGNLDALVEGALLTPSARDRMRDLGVFSESKAGAKVKDKASVTSASGAKELEAFFHLPEHEEIKRQICDVGERLWQRAYVDGNGGNLAVKVGKDLAICTPTLVSKGFMKPEDMCLVDLEGRQLAGRKKRTSEILMHLQIMAAQPKATATCHCHPPNATGFAVAGVTPPTCMIPEIEVFIGKVPIAPYLTPGTREMGAEVAKLADKHNTILMANHGVVSWSNTIEDAYFKMEIIEAYCRTVLVATQLGTDLKTFTPGQLKDLLDIKQGLGIPDPRIGLKECELCDNEEWRPGVRCSLPQPGMKNAAPGESAVNYHPEAEAVVQKVTDEIMARLKL